MNKFILPALLATAFAQDKCATAEQLNNGDGKTKYYLRYLLQDKYNKETAFTTDDATTGEYIGYEESAANHEALKIGKKSTFTIQKTTDGFEVHSKENTTERIFSWNQGLVKDGYYMYKTSTKPYVPKYTRFTYDEATKTLKAKPDNSETTYPLGVSKGDVTEIYRQNKLKDASKANFCFWKVEKPSTPPQQCKGGDLPELTSFDAVFKDEKCKAGQMVDSSNTCEATCKSGTHGTPVKYTCTDGKWNKPKSIVCKPDKAICKVDDKLLAKLKEFNAEFKEEKCQKGSEIDEDNTCEASCKENFKGDEVKYTCDKNGKFTAPEEKDIACKNSFAQFGVLGALLCLFALH